MTGASTPAMDIGGGGGRRSERFDSDRTSEDMSYISSAPKEFVRSDQFDESSEDLIQPHSFVDLAGDAPDAARATVHEPNYRFGGMPSLKEETDFRMYLENDVPLLPGEVRQPIVDKVFFNAEDGFVTITNYRLIHGIDKEPKRLIILPLAEIESCEMLRTFEAKLVMKVGRIHTMMFSATNEAIAIVDHLKRICSQLNRFNSRVYQKNERTEGYLGTSSDVVELFAWEFSKAVDKELPSWLKRSDYVANEITHIDFKRLGMEESFRISTVNENFAVCPTYPEKIIVPKTISDEELRVGAPYRSIARFPAIVWRCTKTKSVLMRSSQPQVGILSWRNAVDEKMIEEAVKAGRVDGEEKKQFIIQDARAYTSAFANRARSGGFENSENYQQAKMDFLGLPNIHAIRHSFDAIRTMLHQQTPNEQMLQTLQHTGWLLNISNLLVHAANCAEYLSKGHSVLVHCSDGWDRTTQITTLAKLMLDEYYRTIDGFSELIRRDWIGFGHKLSDRSICSSDSERSPIFSQFLEAVRHLQRVQPTAFQFSHAYLIKLAQHAYSGLFGTFLFNSQKEKKEAMEYRNGTLVEIWRFLNSDNDEFVNQTYDEKYVGPLKGEWNFGVHYLNIWHELFADKGVPSAEADRNARGGSGNTTPVTNSVPAIQRSKSVESVKSIAESSQDLNQMTSSFHQPVVLSATNDTMIMLDYDGLIKLDDEEQLMLRKKNRIRQEEIQKRDREIKELKRQRALSHSSATGLSHSPINGRRMHSVSESDNEPGLERAMSDLSMVDPETEMPNFRANTTWEAKSTICNICAKGFIEMSVYMEDRQHHCRNCGKVVCDSCSKHRFAVVEEGKSVQKRACDTCYDSMHENSNGEKMPSSPVFGPDPEPVYGPVQKPVQEPIHEPVQGPAQEPVQEPVQDPVPEPAQEPVQEPVQKPKQVWRIEPPRKLDLNNVNSNTISRAFNSLFEYAAYVVAPKEDPIPSEEDPVPTEEAPSPPEEALSPPNRSESPTASAPPEEALSSSPVTILNETSSDFDIMSSYSPDVLSFVSFSDASFIGNAPSTSENHRVENAEENQENVLNGNDENRPQENQLRKRTKSSHVRKPLSEQNQTPRRTRSASERFKNCPGSPV